MPQFIFSNFNCPSCNKPLQYHAGTYVCFTLIQGKACENYNKIVRKVIDEFTLPNGHTCIVEENKAGGRSYISDEIGGGVLIYDTCLQDQSSVLACLTKEAELEITEWRRVNAKAKHKISPEG